MNGPKSLTLLRRLVYSAIDRYLGLNEECSLAVRTPLYSLSLHRTFDLSRSIKQAIPEVSHSFFNSRRKPDSRAETIPNSVGGVSFVWSDLVYSRTKTNDSEET